jgi:putative membrane protein
LPAAEDKVRELADRIRTFEKEGNLNELIDLLTHNAAQESDFFAAPVVLKENKLFPIPNYGSAMSPFFTTLSLWVGALLLVSLLTVEVHDGSAVFHSYQVYFGRYLTFLTIALVQSLFVTLGDIWLLKTYVADKIWFVLFGLLLSGAFTLIVYTLVSVFGNVGKAMAIVLLVLQLAGSGGTFPIEVTPPFFQAIHPFLPFTYAIGMMREAVGGILWDVVLRDTVMIAIFAAVALVVGLGLKRWINRVSAGLVRKAKEGGLIH